jgi:hypothetical protein
MRWLLWRSWVLLACLAVAGAGETFNPLAWQAEQEAPSATAAHASKPVDGPAMAQPVVTSDVPQPVDVRLDLPRVAAIGTTPINKEPPAFARMVRQQEYNAWSIVVACVMALGTGGISWEIAKTAMRLRLTRRKADEHPHDIAQFGVLGTSGLLVALAACTAMAEFQIYALVAGLLLGLLGGSGVILLGVRRARNPRQMAA